MLGTVRLLSGLLALILLAAPALAELSPRDYLSRMSHSFRELNYRGVFTYEYGRHMESMRIVHAVRDGEELERLIYLNGEPREFIRNGHALSCVHPGDQILRLGNSISGGPFARTVLRQVENIEQHYKFAFGDVSRVADRNTVHIQVLARDPWRYSFHMFLDEETGLLLKSLTIAADGMVLERFQFATIDIGATITDEELAGDGEDAEVLGHHRVELTAEDNAETELGERLRLQWLPEGFMISARSAKTVGDQQTDMAMFSDGFSTVTVVLEPVAGQQIPADGRARRGATVAYLRPLVLDGHPYLLTVVGEVPIITAEKIALNVVAKGA